jgi:hypothetical protein
LNDFFFNRFRPQEEEEKENQRAYHPDRGKKVKIFSASLSFSPASTLPRGSHLGPYFIQPDEFSQWNRSVNRLRIADWGLRNEKPSQRKLSGWTYGKLAERKKGGPDKKTRLNLG